MREEDLLDLLQKVAGGELDTSEALEQLRDLPFERVGDFAAVDTHRSLRCGFAEVLLAEGKTVDQCRAIASALISKGGAFLATRVSPEQAEALLKEIPGAEYVEIARIVRYLPKEGPGSDPEEKAVAVVSAGTADQPVAEEAALTAETMGLRVERVYDVGIAGLHRLLAHRETLDRASAVIVVAGMEGALPSAVGGLVSTPVIAVPTSVGYGVAKGGWVALLGMLATCASGVTVVNIDNGFGAAYAAARIVWSLRGKGRVDE